MSKRSNRLSLLFALTIIFSALQTITKPNISNANPYDPPQTFFNDANAVLDYGASTGRTCEFLANRANQEYNSHQNYMTYSQQSVNSDNQFRYQINARDSYNRYLSLFNEWQQKGCDRQ